MTRDQLRTNGFIALQWRGDATLSRVLGPAKHWLVVFYARQSETGRFLWGTVMFSSRTNAAQ